MRAFFFLSCHELGEDRIEVSDRACRSHCWTWFALFSCSAYALTSYLLLDAEYAGIRLKRIHCCRARRRNSAGLEPSCLAERLRQKKKQACFPSIVLTGWHSGISDRICPTCDTAGLRDTCRPHVLSAEVQDLFFSCTLSSTFQHHRRSLPFQQQPLVCDCIAWQEATRQCGEISPSPAQTRRHTLKKSQTATPVEGTVGGL